jgi:hypothetical protein
MTLRLLLPVNPDGGEEAVGAQGPPGANGEGVPPGGSTGQSLVKASNTDGDVDWETMASLLALGQVANEVADLVAALGDPDQIAWGAGFDAAGEATGFPADAFFGALITVLTGDIPTLTQAIADETTRALGIEAGLRTDVDAAGAAAAAAALAASDAMAAVVTETSRAEVAELDLARDMRHISFEINAATATPISDMGFDVIELNALAYDGAVRSSEGDVDNHVTFPIAGEMHSADGLWTFTLSHFTGPDVGIYSIETTDDLGATWDVKGTVDGYAAIGAAEQTVVTGVTVAAENDSIRLRMGTKNGSSSDFFGHVSALSGYFVFT